MPATFAILLEPVISSLAAVFLCLENLKRIVNTVIFLTPFYQFNPRQPENLVSGQGTVGSYDLKHDMVARILPVRVVKAEEGTLLFPQLVPFSTDFSHELNVMVLAETLPLGIPITSWDIALLSHWISPLGSVVA